LQTIQLQRWSLAEKIGEAWHSFWTFDNYRPYSINFLWGPLFTSNPVGRSQLFTTLPPKGWSANRLFLTILGVVALLLFLHWWLIAKRGQRPLLRTLPAGISGHLVLFFMVFAALWLVLDLRMGMEFLRYVKTDYTAYIAKPAGEKLFRDHRNFEDVMQQSLPVLQQQPRYLFLGPSQTPFLARMRYFTFPSVPVEEGQNEQDVHTILVFERPDIAMDSQNRLTQDGQVMTSPGKILQRFSDQSFLFQLP
jgi:hypothetical protein